MYLSSKHGYFQLFEFFYISILLGVTRLKSIVNLFTFFHLFLKQGLYQRFYEIFIFMLKETRFNIRIKFTLKIGFLVEHGQDQHDQEIMNNMMNPKVPNCD